MSITAGTSGIGGISETDTMSPTSATTAARDGGGAGPLLEVDGLQVDFVTANGWVTVVNGVSFTVGRGETVGLVGESGSGKTVTGLSIMRLIPSPPGRVREGSVTLDGRELRLLTEAQMRSVRGRDIAMIFQEPMTSLNPAYTVGDQIAETVRHHMKLTRRRALDRAVEMLDLVGIPNPRRRAGEYPHQFSGGMRQRVMIAMALSCEPKLLIADEPTTALDVTIQAQVLDLLRTMRRELGMAILFVTHDLGVVAELCDRVAVMYAGEVVETGSADTIFHRPEHPYTRALLGALPQLGERGGRLSAIPGRTPEPWAMPDGCRFHPRCEHATDVCRVGGSPQLAALGAGAATRCIRHLELTTATATPAAVTVTSESSETPLDSPLESPRPDPRVVSDRPLLEVSQLSVEFRTGAGFFNRGRVVRAVQDVSFTLHAGETLGLVGESGSGKSTTARGILRLVKAASGRVVLDGVDLTARSRRELTAERRHLQMVFQDPYSSLNPSMRIAECVGEPFIVHEGARAAERDAKVADLLERVGLSRRHLDRYPSEFSGGQRQRLAIARAVALRPKLVACDEAVSALDVSTRNQIINLLEDLQAEFGLTYLFISHDLSVVRHIAHRVAVLYLGRIVEIGPVERVYRQPGHPYTEALLSAVPRPDPSRAGHQDRIILQGDVPDPSDPPSGCPFHPRCPYVLDVCREVLPTMTDLHGGGSVACHLQTAGPLLNGESVLALRTRRSTAASEHLGAQP